MYHCKNGPPHQHETAEQGKICWGVIAPPAPPPVPAAGPTWTDKGSESSTVAQRNYVRDLGGDLTLASGMTKRECSDYISNLKTGRSPRVTEPPAALTPPAKPESRVPGALLQMVREGRYAVRPDDAHPYTFLRISTRKTGKFRDGLIVQTQHGPALSDVKLVLWPSGQLSCYRYDIEEPLLLVIADQQGAARAYARELGRCARCGLELTDEQSRRWGVGPECIKHWPHMAVLAEEEASG